VKSSFFLAGVSSTIVDRLLIAMRSSDDRCEVKQIAFSSSSDFAESSTRASL
jgi:hypothetical protein